MSSLLALLTLLHGRRVLLITVLLAKKFGALEARLVNASLGLSTETCVGHQRTLLNLVVGIEELEQAVGAADLVEVGRVAGIAQTTLSLSLLSLLVVTLLLSPLLLAVTLSSLTVVGLICLLLSVIVILELTDSGVLF